MRHYQVLTQQDVDEATHMKQKKKFKEINKFFLHPKDHHMGGLFYLARHVVAAHLEQLQLILNLLKIFETPSSIFVQLG